MGNDVYVKNYAAPDINMREIMRYSGIGAKGAELDGLVLECLEEAQDKLSYKVCYCVLPVKISGKTVDFGVFEVESGDLAKNLEGCTRAVIFAASIGVEFDRLIRKHSILAPSKSVIFQGIGAERAESLCDVFCNEIAHEYIGVKPRFSPGYGDFPLEVQRDIFRILKPEQRIGITLTESLLMVPSKSVTAIMGIRNKL